MGIAIYAVILMTMFVIASMVVNLSFAFGARNKLQQAVDATAIATGEYVIDHESLKLPGNSAQLKSFAQKILETNLTQKHIALSRFDSTTFRADYTSGSPEKITIHADIASEGFLLNLFQKPAHESAVYALSGGSKPVIAALAMDVSRYVPAAQIQTVKDAATAFVNNLSTGDYFSLVTFGEVYCMPLPVAMTKILDTSGAGGKTKAEIISDLTNNVRRNCDLTNVREGTYVQGAIYKARQEISALSATLGDSWNSFSKNIVIVTDCRVTRSTPHDAPISDSLILDGYVKTAGTGAIGMPQGQCTAPDASTAAPGVTEEPKMRAAAIHQADIARSENIEVSVIATSRLSSCDDIAPDTDGTKRQTALRRLAYDQGWDGTSVQWETNPASICGGYSLTKWCSKGALYRQCNSNVDCDTQVALGDGECIAPTSSTKSRFGLLETGFSTATYVAAVSEWALKIKRGLLVSS